MRTCAIRAVLIAALLLAAGCQQTVAGEASDSEKPRHDPTVKINPKDYCNACIAVLELFFDKTIERAIEAQKRHGSKAEIDGTEMMYALCRDPVWKKYNDRVAYGCQKVVAEHAGDVFAPFNGRHFVGNSEELYNHKVTACTKIEACKPGGMVVSSLTDKTECGACEAIAKDIHFLVDREESVRSITRLKVLVASVCDDLALRHPTTSAEFLDEYCDEMLEEIGVEDIARALRLRKGMETSMFKLTTTFPEKMCSEMSSYCKAPKAAKKEL